MIRPEVLDALIAAGATAEMIVAAVKADAVLEAASSAERRARDAQRKRISRVRQSQNNPQRSARVTPVTPGPAPSAGQPVTAAEAADASGPGFPQKNLYSKPLSQSPPIIPPFPFQDAVDRWNAMAKRCGLPEVQGLTGRRREALAERIAEHGVDGFRRAVAAVAQSKFLLGENNRGWKADIGFLLKPDNYIKLIEGGYGKDASPKKLMTAEECAAYRAYAAKLPFVNADAAEAR